MARGRTRKKSRRARSKRSASASKAGSQRRGKETRLQPIAESSTDDRQAEHPTGPDLSGEYRYVIADLKRIALTAASMFVLLVILSFLLT